MLKAKDVDVLEFHSEIAKFNVNESIETYNNAESKLAGFISISGLAFTIVCSTSTLSGINFYYFIPAMVFIILSFLLSSMCYCTSIRINGTYSYADKDFIKARVREDILFEYIMTSCDIQISHKIANEYKRKIISVSIGLLVLGLVVLAACICVAHIGMGSIISISVVLAACICVSCIPRVFF